MKSSSTNNCQFNFLTRRKMLVCWLLCLGLYGSVWGQQAKNITRNLTFSTIQAAINDGATVAGDVIEISNGVYNEHVLINKEITIQGVSTAAIIKAPYSNNNSNANTVSINSANVTLKNLTITRDYGTTLQQWNECTVNQGVSFNTKSNIRLENLIVKDNRNGVYCSNSQNLTIVNCVIENNRTGIQLTHNASGLVMTNNVIRNNFTHGALFNFDNGLMTLTNAKVQHNSIAGNWYSQLNFQRAAGAESTNIGDFTGANFSCNWYGVASPTVNPILAAEPGYVGQTPSQFGGENPGLSDRYLIGALAESIPSYTPFLKNGTDLRTDIPGFQPMPNGCTPVVNKNRNTYFTTIQEAINDVVTVAGDTILVGEGNFVENIIVSKSLVIFGPNAGINPNTGSRIEEAIIRPAVRQISTDNSTSGTIIRVAGTGHLDVTINGFTLDGNNPILSGGRVLNGVEVHTGAGIVNSTNSFDTNPGGSDATMIIQNNIIRNVERYGVLADGVLPVKALAGTNVSYNKFDNIPSGDNFGGERGRAAAFVENHYGTFAYNVVTRVNVGWQDDNYYRASPGAGTVLEHNEIHTYRRGIFHNLQYSNATTARISNNTITKETSGDFDAATENFGVEIASVQHNVGATIDSNDVSGMKYGILLWNNPTTNTVKVSGGTLTANQYGILATSNDPQFAATTKASKSIISNVKVMNSVIAGIAINDSLNYSQTSLTITDSTTISGGAKGLVLNGVNTAITNGMLNNTTFAGQTGNYIELINSTGDIDGSNATFGAKKAIAMSESERTLLEEKLVHKPDDVALGKICLPNTATLSVKSGSPSAYCIGGSTVLVADINGVIGPFTLVYTDGTNETTINNYVNGADIPVNSNSTKTYSIVSISDNIGCSTSSGFGDAFTVTVNPIPSKPSITPTSTTICAGTTATLTASACAEGNLQWTGGLTGTSITVSPSATNSYKVVCTQLSCTSDSSEVALITVNPTPDKPTITPAGIAICAGSSTTLTASACEEGTLHWTGGLTGTSITVNPSSTKSYKVVCTQLSCTSDSSDVITVTVNPIPDKPTIASTSGLICAGSSITLTASACTGGSLHWTGGLTGTSITVSLSATNSYKVVCTQLTCTSDSSNVATVTVNPIPDKPTIVPASTAICVGSSTTLTASVCAEGTLHWTGGLTGTSITVNPSSTKSYKVVCTQLSCTSDSSDIATVTVNPIPDKPTISPTSASICIGSSTILTASACTGGTLRWTGGLTGSSISVSPTITKSYKVVCTQLNCTSDSSNVTTIAVNPIPGKPTITPGSAAICIGSSTTLTASACTGGSMHWTGGLTGTSITVSPTNTKSYKVVCTQLNCTGDSSNVATVTVNPIPEKPTITPVSITICAGASTTLTASACAGGSLHWTGGLTGTSITVSPNTTKSYKVVCTQLNCPSDSSNATIVTVNPIPNTPTIVSTFSAICIGASTTLSVSGCEGGTVKWTEGLSGTSITVSPVITKNYKAICTQLNCASDSSAASIITIKPKPSAPIITSDSTTICNGQTLALTGSCSAGTIQWSGGSTNNNLIVTTTGTYTAVCINNGCTSETGSRVVTSGSCRFVSINPATPIVCPGKSITLKTSGCNGGSITWSGGATGAGTSITVSPDIATVYVANCSLGSTASTTVNIAANNVIVAGHVLTGVVIVKAIQTIESDKEIGDGSSAPMPNVTYQAGNSILLNPGFMVEKGAVFKAEIQGCN